jgi:hypothetical protein
MIDLAPALPAGVATVTEVPVFAVIFAAVPPIVTLVALSRLAPEITISVPPAVGPPGGVTDVIVGASMYRNALADVTLPPYVVVNTTFCSPETPDGVVNRMLVPLTFTTPVADTPPTVTPEVFARFAPVTVTVVPPVVSPVLVLSEEMTGRGT